MCWISQSFRKVHLAEGLNALVVSVVSIEIAGKPAHESPVAGFFYFLHFAVRHIGFPVADGGAALESWQPEVSGPRGSIHIFFLIYLNVYNIITYIY